MLTTAKPGETAIELAEKALKLCEKKQAKYASVSLRETAELWMSFRNGSPVMIAPVIDEGMSVRIAYADGIGFSSTNQLDTRGISDAVARAHSMARASKAPAPDLRSGVAENAKWEVAEKEKLDNLSDEEKIKRMLDLDKEITASTEHKSYRNLSYGEKRELKFYCDTEGTSVQGRDTKLEVSYLIMLQAGGETEQVYRDIGYTGGEEGFENASVVSKALEDVRGISRMLSEGKAFKRERLDVICGSEVTGIACHESCGHPMEADRILGREASQAGKSFVTPASKGMRVGSRLVTIVDDPLLPNSFGYYEFDDEGVRARRRILYSEGVVNEFLQDRESGSRTGAGSNGAGRSSSYALEPLVRMANTFLLPGDYTEEELIDEVKHGVFIKGFNEWNIDDRRYNQKYVGREAYMIENGEITTPVRSPVIEITTPGFWQAVTAVGRQLQFFGGSCGKGDPMQGMEVDMGGPMIKLSGVLIK
ncbi:MAG: TldD/PmbA family protein [Methanomassiliicoccales archaeon]